MFDPYVWSCVDGALYIARESFLLGKVREQDANAPKLFGFWNEALVVRRAAQDLRRLKSMGEA